MTLRELIETCDTRDIDDIEIANENKDTLFEGTQLDWIFKLDQKERHQLRSRNVTLFRIGQDSKSGNNYYLYVELENEK